MENQRSHNILFDPIHNVMQRKDYEKWAQFDIDTAYDGYNMQYIIQTL